MLRTPLIFAISAWLVAPLLAGVESFEYQAELRSERTTEPPWLAPTYGLPRSGVTYLEGGDGIAVTSASSSSRLSNMREVAHSGYGRAFMHVVRRRGGYSSMLPPDGQLSYGGSLSLIGKMELLAGAGKASGDVAFSIVERILPPGIELESATLTLALQGEGIHNLSAASVNVFDHDTNELLLSWDGEPIEPNYFIAYRNEHSYVQNFDFLDRVGHAIRFDFHVAGETTHMSSRVRAAVFLNIPEPGGATLALPSLCIAGLVRRRRRR